MEHKDGFMKTLQNTLTSAQTARASIQTVEDQLARARVSIQTVEDQLARAIRGYKQFFCPSAAGRKFNFNQQIVDGILLCAESDPYRDMYTESPKDFSTELSRRVVGLFVNNIPGARRLPAHGYNGFSVANTDIIVKTTGWDNHAKRVSPRWRAAPSMMEGEKTVLLFSIDMPPGSKASIFAGEFLSTPSMWRTSKNYDGLNITKVQIADLYNEGNLHLHVGDVARGYNRTHYNHARCLSSQNISINVLD